MKHRNHCTILSASLALAAACAVLFETEKARAEVPFSVDANYAKPLDVGDATHGFGGQLRFGPRLDLKLITLDSEIVAGGVAFYDAQGDPAAQSYHGLLGPRLGILWGLRPSVFSHLGVGHTRFAPDQNQTSLAGDLGLALDITFLPVIDIGGQAAWNFVAGDGTSPQTQYLTAGLHITFFTSDD
jgi:hypothetical protein